MSELNEKLEDLRTIIRSFQSCLVAYSGGVDSALVASIASEQLKCRALACIGVSPSYPAREMRAAIQVASERQIAYRLVNTEEHLDPNYAANPSNRCYFCKTELHARLRKIANAEGWSIVADGSNLSDLGDIRPGMQAAREHGVRSPLIEAKITKAQVRELAKSIGLSVWDKPAMPCLSSRVPHGTQVTPELLKQIESAEDCLVELGFRQFRVRHHGQIARIEVPSEDLARTVELRQQIIKRFRQSGYLHVCVDLGGFASGSLNVLTL